MAGRPQATPRSLFLRRRIGVTTEALMRMRGLNRAGLAAKLGWTFPKLSRHMNGHTAWSEESLEEMTHALEVPIGILFETPEDAIRFLGFPAETVQAFLANSLTEAQVKAITSRQRGSRARSAA